MDKKIKLFVSILVPLVFLAIPADAFGIPGLTVIEHRIIALFFMALFFWVLEPIPLYATSLLIILVELVFISDKAFVLFRSTAEGFGTALPWQRVIETFADPIIILFLGGFFLAMVSTKYELDINLARHRPQAVRDPAQVRPARIHGRHGGLLDVHEQHGRHGHDARRHGPRPEVARRRATRPGPLSSWPSLSRPISAVSPRRSAPRRTASP